jgi:hypothetical protein
VKTRRCNATQHNTQRNTTQEKARIRQDKNNTHHSTANGTIRGRKIYIGKKTGSKEKEKLGRDGARSKEKEKLGRNGAREDVKRHRRTQQNKGEYKKQKYGKTEQ